MNEWVYHLEEGGGQFKAKEVFVNVSQGKKIEC